MSMEGRWNCDGGAVAWAAIADCQAGLFPEEISCCASFGERRRREFTAGRTLARQLLREAGAGTAALIRRPDGVIVWPEGFHGSISHSRDRVAAAVARGPVGIDLEHIGRVREALLPHIATLAERQRLAGRDPIHRAILFAAKEAYYKLQYPQTEARLGFFDAEVDSCDDGTLTVADARGVWRRVDDDLLLAVVWYGTNGQS